MRQRIDARENEVNYRRFRNSNSSQAKIFKNRIYSRYSIFLSRINTEMVAALPVQRDIDKDERKALIEDHAKLTGSPRAQKLLKNWEKTCKKLIRVIPKTKADLEQAEEQHEAASIPKSKV